MLGRSSRNPLRALFFALALIASCSAFAEDKVVFQVTDADESKWNMVLNNVRNLQKAADPDAQIEIVAYGPAVALLKSGSPIATRINEAVNGKVKVVACKNTMAAMKLTEADMLADVGYVPAGVVEVMRKQQQGYVYIRP